MFLAIASQRIWYWLADSNSCLLAENQMYLGAILNQQVVLGRLSLDQHRTAFSSLYETRTHPFGVAAIETDWDSATTTLEYID